MWHFIDWEKDSFYSMRADIKNQSIAVFDLSWECVCQAIHIFHHFECL